MPRIQKAQARMRSEQAQTRLTKEEKKRLEFAVEDTFSTESEVIRTAIRLYCKKYYDDNVNIIIPDIKETE